MSAIADTRVVYEAVYQHIAAGLNVPLGDTAQPTAIPHATLYAISGGELDGPLGAPDDDISMQFQINCVSTRRDQAQWLQTRVRTLMLNRTLTIPGRSVWRVRLDFPSGIARDDKLGEREGQVFYSTDTFTVVTVPG